MLRPRWYPTLTTLGNGRVLSVSGRGAGRTLERMPGVQDPIFFLQEVPLGFYSTTLLGLWSLYELVPSVIAGLVAGALYKD